jgi:glycosyltransferase involved in cell wall biosynthesis
MRRALFVTQSHNVWGGMEQWLHNFTRWLQEQPEWDVRVALPRGRRFNDPDAYVRAHPHIHPMLLDVRVGTESARVSSIVRAIETFDPHVLVPIGSGATFPAVAEAKRRGSDVRFLPTVRGVVPALMANIVDFWPSVDGVVSISRFFDRYFHEVLPVEDAARMHYVRHGAKPAFVPHVDAPKLRVGYVGRLTHDQKRVGDLIPFAAAAGENIELHIYGDGPAESELRANVPRAILHGYQSQDDLYRSAYPNLDVLMLFSENEGTPNAVCEAMHHGVVPVIARYLGEADERFVTHGRSGFTFRIGDVAQAAAYVRTLANDRALLRVLSEEAKRGIAADTNVRMHRDWVALFERTLELPPKIAPAVSIERGGRLDRLLPAGVADRVRALTGRQFPHIDGWAEWPGSVPVSDERQEQVMATLRRLDAEAQERVYTSAP